MSTSNIIFQTEIPEVGYFIVFETRHGRVLYGFSEDEGAAIEAGTDPQHMNGTKIDGIAGLARFVGSQFIQVAAEALVEFL